MKKLKINSFSAFFILVVLAFGSQQSLALSVYQQDLDSRDYSYLRADQNRQGTFFQEISAPNFSFFSQKETQFFGTWITSSEFNSFSNPNYTAEAINNYFQRDQRKVLNEQIFPFHFFW